MRRAASRREQMNKQIEEIERRRRKSRRRGRRKQLAATCKQIPRPNTVIKMLFWFIHLVATLINQPFLPLPQNTLHCKKPESWITSPERRVESKWRQLKILHSFNIGGCGRVHIKERVVALRKTHTQLAFDTATRHSNSPNCMQSGAEKK